MQSNISVHFREISDEFSQSIDILCIFGDLYSLVGWANAFGANEYFNGRRYSYFALFNS